MQRYDWSIPQREAEYLSTAARDLPVLALADDVTRLLAQTIQQVTIDAHQDARDAANVRRHALWYMAIIALRAMRAAMHAISIGYEDQSLGYQRLIDELLGRARKVYADTSGSYAQEWLAGRNREKGARLAGQDIWELMSVPVHANSRAVSDWLAVSQDDGSVKVILGPERRPQVANPALTLMCTEGRDLASILALEAGVSLDLGSLDHRITEAGAVYLLHT